MNRPSNSSGWQKHVFEKKSRKCPFWIDTLHYEIPILHGAFTVIPLTGRGSPLGSCGMLCHVVAMRWCARHSPGLPLIAIAGQPLPHSRVGYCGVTGTFWLALERCTALPGPYPPHMCSLLRYPGGGSVGQSAQQWGQRRQDWWFHHSPNQTWDPTSILGGVVSISSVLCVLFATKLVIRS